MMKKIQNQLICIMKSHFYEESQQGYPYAKTETDLIIKS